MCRSSVSVRIILNIINMLRYNRKLFSLIDDRLESDSDVSTDSDDDADNVIDRSDNIISPAMLEYL